MSKKCPDDSQAVKMNKAIDAMIQDDADLKDNDDVSTGGQIYYRPHSGEGNVFTSVCHSVHGGCIPACTWAGGCLPRGVSAWRCLPGGVCPGGCLPRGVSARGGVWADTHSR